LGATIVNINQIHMKLGEEKFKKSLFKKLFENCYLPLYCRKQKIKYTKLILSVVLYGCETRFLTLR